MKIKKNKVCESLTINQEISTTLIFNLSSSLIKKSQYDLEITYPQIIYEYNFLNNKEGMSSKMIYTIILRHPFSVLKYIIMLFKHNIELI